MEYVNLVRNARGLIEPSNHWRISIRVFQTLNVEVFGWPFTCWIRKYAPKSLPFQSSSWPANLNKVFYDLIPCKTTVIDALIFISSEQ